MKDGIYKIIFTTNVNRNGMLDGIVTVRDGAINGGDYVCFYKGHVKANKASLKSVPHNKNDTTAFNGRDAVDLELIIEDHINHVLFKGYVKGNESQTIHGQLNFLSELA